MPLEFGEWRLPPIQRNLYFFVPSRETTPSGVGISGECHPQLLAGPPPGHQFLECSFLSQSSASPFHLYFSSVVCMCSVL